MLGPQGQDREPDGYLRLIWRLVDGVERQEGGKEAKGQARKEGKREGGREEGTGRGEATSQAFGVFT